MLIICEDCGKQISDKAFQCINCGCPINSPPQRIKPVKSANRSVKYRRLPNGFGSITKLGGKRRKPFAVYPPIKEYADNGSPIRSKAIGYYETYNQAYQSLCDYNKSPYDTNQYNLTFSEVYELFYKWKYEESKKTYSESSKKCTAYSYKCFSQIHDEKFNKIKLLTLQRILNESPLKRATVEQMVNFINQLYKFALKYEYTDKDFAGKLSIDRNDDEEKGIPFSQADIDLLWENTDDNIVKIILVMIYSGMRISEYKVCKYDYEQKCFIGGLKTSAGKGRIVPMHDKIIDFVPLMEEYGKTTTSLRNEIKSKLAELGILRVQKTVHTPHDCRHTFSWLCDKYKIDKLAKHMIMGHSLGYDIEDTVYGHRTVEELREEINKIK